MTISRTETQVTWPTASNTGSLTASSTLTSETVTLDATCFQAQIHLYTDNTGTIGSGDTVDFYILQTGGDPIGTGSDVYDNTNVAHARWLARLDTNAADPAQVTVPLPLPQKSFKIYAVNNSADAITIGATITEQRG